MTLEGHLHRPIAFMEPERTVHPPSWLDYTPFAFWIVDALRPETFVELGCHSGNSYASFAQAVQVIGLTTACYGVDTWKGDPQAGFFDETVYEEWTAYHRRFSTFSRTIRSTFDEALDHFADGTIDLLHIDGYHTFEAVSHDFEAWRPKMSNRGVVLCHDIAVHDADFGAWRLWDRLKHEYPSFEFRHGHGLGVLGVGHDWPEPVRWLFSQSAGGAEHAHVIRLFFSRLGAAVLGQYTASETQRTLGTEVEQLRCTLSESNVRAAETERLSTEAAALNERIAALTVDLQERDERLARSADEIAHTSTTLRESEHRMAALDAEVAHLRSEVDAAQQALVERAVEIDRLETESRSQDARIAALLEEQRRRETRDRVAGTTHVELSPRPLTRPHAQPPTIVVVSHVGPWRPRAGNEYRLQRMLAWYRRQRYRLILVIAPLPGEELPAEGVEAMADSYRNVIHVHRNGTIEYVLRDLPDVFASLKGAVASSFAGDPRRDQATAHERELLKLERTFCHDALVTTVLHLERALELHILQVEYIWMSGLLRLAGGNVLKVIDTIDLFSNIEKKVAAFGVRDIAITPDEEGERLCRADLVIAIQDDERAELERLAPSVPIVTAGVDFDVAADRGTPRGRQVLYVGSGNARNRKGLEDFLRLAWPMIHKHAPDAELVVAGNVGNAAAGIHAPRVRVLGPVEDVAGLYDAAALVINPVIAGTGVKVKTLEALCHLRPIVTWPAGVDGLDPRLAALCYVARDWYEFAGRVIDVLTTSSGAGLTPDEQATIEALAAPEHVYAALDAAYGSFFEQQQQTRLLPVVAYAGD